jgi:hypothetical protein
MARVRYREALGLELKRGWPPAGPAPSKAHLVRHYVKESLSVLDVAAVLKMTKDADPGLPEVEDARKRLAGLR